MIPGQTDIENPQVDSRRVLPNSLDEVGCGEETCRRGLGLSFLNRGSMKMSHRVPSEIAMAN
jgi:hypothetical protein